MAGVPVRHALVPQGLSRCRHQLDLEGLPNVADERGLHTCLACKLRGLTLAQLRQHQSTVHGYMRNMCSWCERGWPTRESLAAHEAEVHGYYQCHEYRMAWREARHLEEHRRKKHAEQRAVQEDDGESGDAGEGGADAEGDEAQPAFE